MVPELSKAVLPILMFLVVQLHAPAVAGEDGRWLQDGPWPPGFGPVPSLAGLEVLVGLPAKDVPPARRGLEGASPPGRDLLRELVGGCADMDSPSYTRDRLLGAWMLALGATSAPEPRPEDVCLAYAMLEVARSDCEDMASLVPAPPPPQYIRIRSRDRNAVRDALVAHGGRLDGDEEPGWTRLAFEPPRNLEPLAARLRALPGVEAETRWPPVDWNAFLEAPPGMEILSRTDVELRRDGLGWALRYQAIETPLPCQDHRSPVPHHTGTSRVFHFDASGVLLRISDR